MAGNAELLKRAEDLRSQCERNSSVTFTHFLTPAEQYEINNWSKHAADCKIFFFGGVENTDRKVCFFLPFWWDENSNPGEDEIKAVEVQSYFGAPGHRDYLGSIMALGIKREWLGDIIVNGDKAYILCLPGILSALTDMDHVGRYSVKVKEIPISEVPVPKIETRTVTFTVQSPRFDTVVGAMFGLSRTAASKLIQGGLAQLNYTDCIKVDAEVKEGDIVSLRGYGKGILSETGGQSKKGRTFLTAEIYK